MMSLEPTQTICIKGQPLISGFRIIRYVWGQRGEEGRAWWHKLEGYPLCSITNFPGVVCDTGAERCLERIPTRSMHQEMS